MKAQEENDKGKWVYIEKPPLLTASHFVSHGYTYHQSWGIANY